MATKKSSGTPALAPTLGTELGSEKQSVKSGKPEPSGALFFSLNSNYLIEPACKLADLADDVACLLGTGLAVFEKQFEELDEASFAGLYLLRQAKAVFDEVHRRIPSEITHG